jgi:hypothetical protein
MKRFIAITIAICFSLTSFAQGTRVTTPSRNNPNYVPAAYCQAGQLLNIANAYPGTLLDTPATGTQTTYLYTAINGSLAAPKVTPSVAADTFVPYPVYGDGQLTIVVNGLKISGTPAGKVVLEESPNGIIWGNSPADVVASTTDTIANVATVQKFTFKRSVKSCPFYRVRIETNGTQQSSWSAQYFLNPRRTLTN